ncbi:MAG: endonuclease V [Thermoprotei archaeon]|nr:MAG: endonuclease V [Thermoprotei archaeon]
MPRKGAVRVPRGFSLSAARRAQRIIAARVVKRDLISAREVELVGGVDVAYSGDAAVGAWVTLDYETMEVVDEGVSVVKLRFPYVPTLLSFREVSPAASAYLRLKVKPQVSLVDGQGLLHPYRAGFASHLGVALDVATIGVAKKLLCGSVGEWRGSWAPIVDRGEVIGAALRSKGGKVVYVSVGNKVSLETALEIVARCIREHWLPEPIRAAHNLATRTARGLRAPSRERRPPDDL